MKLKTVEDYPDRLLKINIKLPSDDINHDHYVEDTPARRAISSIFNINNHYTFLQTTANPEAVEEIPKYSKKLARIRGSREGWTFLFDADIMDVYLGALDVVMNKYLGKGNYASYQLVENRGVHMIDRLHEQPFWPVVHVLKHDQSDEDNVSIFKELIKHLNDNDDIYAAIKKRESPQNYNMGTINLLRDKNIQPLLIYEREWKIDGKHLKDDADFLSSIAYVEKWTGPVADID